MNIADRYAALEVQIEALEAEMGKLRKEIIKEGCAQIEGETAIVTLSLAERTSLNPDAVKKLLTPDQIVACSKTAVIETVRVKLKLATGA